MLLLFWFCCVVFYFFLLVSILSLTFNDNNNFCNCFWKRKQVFRARSMQIISKNTKLISSHHRVCSVFMMMPWKWYSCMHSKHSIFFLTIYRVVWKIYMFKINRNMLAYMWGIYVCMCVMWSWAHSVSLKRCSNYPIKSGEIPRGAPGSWLSYYCRFYLVCFIFT